MSTALDGNWVDSDLLSRDGAGAGAGAGGGGFRLLCGGSFGGGFAAPVAGSFLSDSSFDVSSSSEGSFRSGRFTSRYSIAS